MLFECCQSYQVPVLVSSPLVPWKSLTLPVAGQHLDPSVCYLQQVVEDTFEISGFIASPPPLTAVAEKPSCNCCAVAPWDCRSMGEVVLLRYLVSL